MSDVKEIFTLTNIKFEVIDIEEIVKLSIDNSYIENLLSTKRKIAK
jgi:hypothetical protein